MVANFTLLIYIYIYIRGAYDKFPDFFFVMALLLIVHTWNSTPLRSNLLQLQCNCYTVPTTSRTPHGSPLVWACQWPSSQPLSSPQLSHNDSLWTSGKKSHREQGLDYREAEERSWCPSCSNSLWQGWSYELVHCPGGNATDPIWRVLASSNRISSWTPLKPQHSNLNPNPICQSTFVYWLPYSSHASHNPLQTPCFPWISYTTQKLMLDSGKIVEKHSEAFHKFLWHFFQV